MKVIDLRRKIPTKGRMALLRVEISNENIPFCHVAFSLSGKEIDNGLRLDTGKGVFLNFDDYGFTAVEISVLEEVAPKIVSLIAQHYEKTERIKNQLVNLSLRKNAYEEKIDKLIKTNKEYL